MVMIRRALIRLHVGMKIWISWTSRGVALFGAACDSWSLIVSRWIVNFSRVVQNLGIIWSPHNYTAVALQRRNIFEFAMTDIGFWMVIANTRAIVDTELDLNDSHAVLQLWKCHKSELASMDFWYTRMLGRKATADSQSNSSFCEIIIVVSFCFVSFHGWFCRYQIGTFRNVWQSLHDSVKPLRRFETVESHLDPKLNFSRNDTLRGLWGNEIFTAMELKCSPHRLEMIFLHVFICLHPGMFWC